MIKVLQYGEGNFLRAFADAYFNTLNEEGGNYEVTIIKPAPFGNLAKFKEQNNGYNVVLRGFENGKTIESVYPISCIKRAIDPFIDYNGYISTAKEDDLKIIISNTTEAGICYNENDSFDGFENVTFPAKLTKFLYERFLANKSGVYLLPVELIDNNADNLKLCVDKYITLWNLPTEFKIWNDTQNYYCNTLVDRIVSGFPRDEQTKSHLFQLVKREDQLLTIGEPFGLWAVENKGEISKYIKEGIHNIEVVLTNDIAYYKKRKVRVLNGSHTNLVPAGLMLGAITVYDCMKDERLSAFVSNTLKEEIIPFVSNDVLATTKFAESVSQRFLNPFLNHQLTSIALNSVSKWKARNLPSFKDYYNRYGKIPTNLTVGLSYLIALYKCVKLNGDKYEVELKNRTIELSDDKKYLDYFANNQPIGEFLSNIDVWGEDLTAYDGLLNAVEENVEKIEKGVCLL